MDFILSINKNGKVVQVVPELQTSDLHMKDIVQ